jgi:NAD(P)-dependent dehydrogenase (short-subunit alcohol dehydrogenase family)
MNKLNKSVVFVTGANRGIGKALVEAALEKGASKVYAACRNPENKVNYNDDRVVHITLDITNQHQVEQAAKTAIDTTV